MSNTLADYSSHRFKTSQAEAVVLGLGLPTSFVLNREKFVGSGGQLGRSGEQLGGSGGEPPNDLPIDDPLRLSTLNMVRKFECRVAGISSKIDNHLALYWGVPPQTPRISSVARDEIDRRRRRGVTLIELLVVVAILIVLMGVTATVILPLRQGRDIREGARAVHAYLSLAQVRAIERQRPVGVWLLRLSTDPNDPGQHTSLELAMGDVPPPYAGDTLSSHAEIPESTDPNVGEAALISVSGANDLVRVGDYIRFDYRGPLRVITNIYDIEFDSYTVSFEPPTRYPRTVQVPFQVMRLTRPANSAVDLLQLPDSVAIDIAFSGAGPAGTLGNFGVHPAIMFSPSGRIDRIVDGDTNSVPAPPVSPFHLLIGRPDKINPVNAGDPSNLEDPLSLWVSIDHRTGHATSTENFVNPQTIPATLQEALVEARTFAVDAQGMSGG